MKANAPEKIYLHIRPNKEIGSTWHGNKISDTDIEYTRTDAFAEKAIEWLKNSTYGYLTEKWGETEIDRETLASDFVNYMKGE